MMKLAVSQNKRIISKFARTTLAAKCSPVLRFSTIHTKCWLITGMSDLEGARVRVVMARLTSVDFTESTSTETLDDFVSLFQDFLPFYEHI